MVRYGGSGLRDNRATIPAKPNIARFPAGMTCCHRPRLALSPALTGACMTVTDGPVIDLDALRRKYAEERA